MDDWERRYRRKVMDFLKAPQDVDLNRVTITPMYEEAWGSPGYDDTYEPARFEVRVTWIHPAYGTNRYSTIYNDEVADLIRSFG